MSITEHENLIPVQSPATARSAPPVPAIDLARRRVNYLLRLSLAIVFFWFGALKIADISPVVELVQNSFPLLARPPYLKLLGAVEIMIASGLVIDWLSKYAATLMILHLLGALSVALVSPHLVFAPAFPALTILGEFIAKNIVFIAAGLVVISSHER